MLWAAAVAAFMNLLDASAVNVALPAILADYEASVDEGAWVILVYSAMLASTVLFFGQVCDHLGPRRLLAHGFLGFTLASAACGLAPSLDWLVLARIFQGITGAVLSATSMAIVGGHVPPEHRGKAIGMLSAASALGSLLGAPLGGLLAAGAGWRWIFLINLPVGMMAWLALRLAPPAADSATRQTWRPDVPGALLSVLGFTGVISSLALASSPHAESAVPAGLLGLFSLLCLVALVAWERRCPSPLLDLELLGRARFRDANAANFCASAFLLGGTFLLPFYLRYGQGLSQRRTGLALLVFGAVFVLASPQAGRLSDRWGAARLSTLAASAAALVMLGFAGLAGQRGLLVPMICLALMGLTYAGYLAPNNRRILSLAPAERQGAASGILRLVYYLGGAMGVCAIESLFTLLLPGGGEELPRLSREQVMPAFQAGLAACGALMALAAVFAYRSGLPEPEQRL